jgi:hypothetical protein
VVFFELIDAVLLSLLVIALMDVDVDFVVDCERETLREVLKLSLIVKLLEVAELLDTVLLCVRVSDRVKLPVAVVLLLRNHVAERLEVEVPEKVFELVSERRFDNDVLRDCVADVVECLLLDREVAVTVVESE